MSSSWWDRNLPERMDEFSEWTGDADAVSKIHARKYVKLRGYRSLLDVGAGRCVDAVHYEGDLRYLAVDSSAYLARRARALLGIEIGLMDAEALGFKSASIDVVYARHVLEHLGGFEKALAEMIRVARREVLVVWFLDPRSNEATTISCVDGLFQNKYAWRDIEVFLCAQDLAGRYSWESVGEEEAILHVVKPTSKGDPEEPWEIGLLLIATRKYKQYVEQLVWDLERFFFMGQNVTVHLFTDEEIPLTTQRIKVLQYAIDSYGFPEATLLRYAIFDDYSTAFDEEDFLFYLDVDMRMVAPVGTEIMGDLVAVHHMGGEWEERPESTAYLDPRHRGTYVAGGFQGGERNAYLSAVKTLRDQIDLDTKQGITAVWHDESHWNKYLAGRSVRYLPLDYCCPVIDPKVVVIEKGHLL